ELTASGAFITCPHPYAVGESFAIKILLNQRRSHRFQVEVIWNNQNVINEEIIVRGMKVRFLSLSGQERKMIQETIALRLQAKALP
ncbi:MAG: PilZ domain-containing protein, partial [Desulfobacterales bacterium]